MNNYKIAVIKNFKDFKGNKLNGVQKFKVYENGQVELLNGKVLKVQQSGEYKVVKVNGIEFPLHVVCANAYYGNNYGWQIHHLSLNKADCSQKNLVVIKDWLHKKIHNKINKLVKPRYNHQKGYYSNPSFQKECARIAKAQIKYNPDGAKRILNDSAQDNFINKALELLNK